MRTFMGWESRIDDRDYTSYIFLTRFISNASYYLLHRIQLLAAARRAVKTSIAVAPREGKRGCLAEVQCFHGTVSR